MPTKTEAKSQSPCSADAWSTKRKKEVYMAASTWPWPIVKVSIWLPSPQHYSLLSHNSKPSQKPAQPPILFCLGKGHWWIRRISDGCWQLGGLPIRRPGQEGRFDRSQFGKACWTHQIFGDFCPYKMKDTKRSANLKWVKFLKTAKHQSAFRVCDVSECYGSVTCSKNCSVWNSSVSTYWHSETVSFMHLWPVSLISALIHAGAKIIYIYGIYIYNHIQNVIVQVSCSKCRKPSKHCHEFKHRQTLLTSPMHFWGAIACE